MHEGDARLTLPVSAEGGRGWGGIDCLLDL